MQGGRCTIKISIINKRAKSRHQKKCGQQTHQHLFLCEAIRVCWWVRTTPPTNGISLLSHVRQRKNLVLRWLGVHTGGGSINISIGVNREQHQVQNTQDQQHQNNAYNTHPKRLSHIDKPRASARKPWITVGRCVRRGRGGKNIHI